MSYTLVQQSVQPKHQATTWIFLLQPMQTLTFTLQACVNIAWIIAPQQSVQYSKTVLCSTAELKPRSHWSFWNDATWNRANRVWKQWQLPYSKEQRTKHANYTSPFPEGKEQKPLNKNSVEWDLLEWWRERQRQSIDRNYSGFHTLIRLSGIYVITHAWLRRFGRKH